MGTLDPAYFKKETSRPCLSTWRTNFSFVSPQTSLSGSLLSKVLLDSLHARSSLHLVFCHLLSFISFVVIIRVQNQECLIQSNLTSNPTQILFIATITIKYSSQVNSLSLERSLNYINCTFNQVTLINSNHVSLYPKS